MELCDIEKEYCSVPIELEALKAFFDHGPVEDIPSYIFKKKEYVSLREYAVFFMGFSVVTKKVCRFLMMLIQDSLVLEVMSGTGAYTATLRSLGGKVIPSDNYSWMSYDNSKYKTWLKRSWIRDIENIDAITAIKKYGKQVQYIMMSWPPQNEPTATQVIRQMRSENPSCRLIYIGEPKGGCTADDSFFNEAIDISEEFPEIIQARMVYHAWENDDYHDTVFLLR